MEDFPEVVYPIRLLEGIHQRSSGQLYRGRPTRIEWTANHLVLLTIGCSPEAVGCSKEGVRQPRLQPPVSSLQPTKASGGIIRVAGITGRIRGMKHKRTDGTSIRPSLVLVDDPQTDESAKSPSQCAARERILAGAILGLAGPGRKIAGLMTVTVVRPDDMADP